MAALRDRLEEHASQPNLRYTQAIVNSGREAGASLEHPHGQLLGMSFIPRELAEEQARFARFVGLVPAVHDHRRRGGLGRAGDLRQRACRGGVPVLERGPLRDARHAPRAQPAPAPQPDRGPHRRGRGASASVLLQLRESVGDVAYNIVFHSAPYRVGEPYHWHAHIWPKATTTAGLRARHRRGHQRDLSRGGGREAAGAVRGGAGLGFRPLLGSEGGRRTQIWLAPPRLIMTHTGRTVGARCFVRARICGEPGVSLETVYATALAHGGPCVYASHQSRIHPSATPGPRAIYGVKRVRVPASRVERSDRLAAPTGPAPGTTRAAGSGRGPARPSPPMPGVCR